MINFKSNCEGVQKSLAFGHPLLVLLYFIRFFTETTLRGEKMIKKKFIITKNTGFARPATLLVSLAYKFKSDIFLEYQGDTVNLKHSTQSIMEILSLGIKPGTKLYIKAVGSDEIRAIQSIKEYFNKKGLIND